MLKMIKRNIVKRQYRIVLIAKAFQATLQNMVSIQVLDKIKNAGFKAPHNQRYRPPIPRGLDQLLNHTRSATNKKTETIPH